MSWQVRQGDALAELRLMDPRSVQVCVTSPPYWGLRDYGTATWEGGDAACDHREVRPQNRAGRETPGGRGGTFPTSERGFRNTCGKCGARRIDSQLGLEPTPDEYVANLVEVFREVRRVLRDDGTVWLNLGDSYASNWGMGAKRKSSWWSTRSEGLEGKGWGNVETAIPPNSFKPGRADGLKVKDLCGIPWRVAFALQADGWWLRSDIIWAKPNPMPESVTDRPTRSHEYIFLLSKSARYFYDADAVREPMADSDHVQRYGDRYKTAHLPPSVISNNNRSYAGGDPVAGRNKRSVWTVATQPYSEAHFATFPPKLIEPCILAGSAAGDTVLDPFCGSGTTGVVALRHDRSFVGIELNPEYVEMARRRITDDAPLLNTGLEAA